MRSTRSPDSPPLTALAERAAFLFDLDGTLVDSSGCHAAAFRAALAEVAPELVPGFEYTSVLGLDTRSALRRLGVRDGALLESLVRQKRAAYRASVERGEVRAFPMAVELLALLRARGKLLVLVTSASRRSAAAALAAAGIEGFFAGSVTGDDVATGKPHPAVYERAVRDFGLAPELSIAVEDAPSGVAASLGAGVEPVVVHGPAPDPSITCFADLGELYRALGGGL